jgi:hypothetical protein
MKASTRERLVKAEEDFLAATALNRRRKKPLSNIVCFHVQQAVEKYLKARLEEAGLSVPKTHDLLHLLNLALATEPLWSSCHGAFSLLVSMPCRLVIPATQLRKMTQGTPYGFAANSAKRPAGRWDCVDLVRGA